MTLRAPVTCDVARRAVSDVRSQRQQSIRQLMEEWGDDFAAFEDGHYLIKATEAIMKSGANRQWVRVE